MQGVEVGSPCAASCSLHIQYSRPPSLAPPRQSRMDPATSLGPSDRTGQLAPTHMSAGWPHYLLLQMLRMHNL